MREVSKISNYIHLFYSDFGKDPMSLVDATKQNIQTRYSNKQQQSERIENQLQDLLDINIGEIMLNNTKSQEYLKAIKDVTTLMSDLREASKDFNEAADYMGYFNKIAKTFDDLINKASREGYFIQDSIEEMKKAREGLDKLKTRVNTTWIRKGVIYSPNKNSKGEYESEIINVFSGLFNNMRGALGEIAGTIGFATASLQGIRSIQSMNIGAGKRLSGVETLIKEDPALKEDAMALDKALKDFPVQPKEDVHVFIKTDKKGGSVKAEILNVGISMKVTTHNTITVHSTNLRAMLSKAYGDSWHFINNLIAGFASDSHTASQENFPKPRIQGNFPNKMLQESWKETIQNAYKLSLADYIAGNGLTGNNVNYLIVNDKVYSIARIMRQLQDNDNIASYQGPADNDWIMTRAAFTTAAFTSDDKKFLEKDPKKRSEKTTKTIMQRLKGAKIKVTLNLASLTAL